MSRSGYSDDYDDGLLAMWRGQVASAIRGRRGQKFLRDLIEALDALPEKKLIRDDLIHADGAVCALGAVGVKRGVAGLELLDPEDHQTLSGVFDIAHQLVQEVEWMNDEGAWNDTPETRWQRMRRWAESCLVPVTA